MSERAPDPALSDTYVSFSIPASSTDIGLVRLVAGGIGSNLHMTVDAIDDLRLVVDEACGLLVETCVADQPGADRLNLRFDVDAHRTAIAIDVTRPGARRAGSPSPVSTMVLDALTSWWRDGLGDAPPQVQLRLPLEGFDPPT